MKGEKKRKAAEPFDITEFLRPDDLDLRSALASLMGGDRQENGKEIIPGPILEPGIELGPGPILIPGPNLKKTPREYPLRQAKTAEEGHSRGEQMVYNTMWKHAKEHGPGVRRIQIGMLGLARLAGMSESNVRVNLRSLVQKLAIEEETGYICESGLGRTYRVYEPEKVVERRQSAGMQWYRKRTLAVIFEVLPG